jgi:hypothetical protein
MWKSQPQQIDRQTTKVTLSDGSQALSFREVIERWQNDAEFRDLFTTVISECAFDGFFWETPPVTARTIERPFECVLIEGASLSRLTPDSSPFKSHFSSRKSEEILTFPNLGGDAVLIVPAPLADERCYTHLARFVREAPKGQVDAFWRSAGLAMQNRIGATPVWLSTSGLGVSWLHLRLDSRPKYYRYEPYKVHA